MMDYGNGLPKWTRKMDYPYGLPKKREISKNRKMFFQAQANTVGK